MTAVLIVDDDPGILGVLRSLLLEEGYTVRTATNGREALHQIQQHQPDLVLLDLMMPELTGWETLVAMRGQGIMPPVAFMSAGGKVQKQAMLYGADGFLAKPFSLDDVLAIVGRYAAAGRIHGPAVLDVD